MRSLIRFARPGNPKSFPTATLAQLVTKKAKSRVETGRILKMEKHGRLLLPNGISMFNLLYTTNLKVW